MTAALHRNSPSPAELWQMDRDHILHPWANFGPFEKQDTPVLTRGAAYPGESLWLYADKDPYYALSHSRENFAAFTRAGGKGSFHEFTVPADNGHWLGGFPPLWAHQLDAYLKHRGLPSAESPSRP